MYWNPLKQCCFLFKHISQRLSRSQTYIKIQQANSSTVRAEVKWRDAGCSSFIIPDPREETFPARSPFLFLPLSHRLHRHHFGRPTDNLCSTVPPSLSYPQHTLMQGSSGSRLLLTEAVSVRESRKPELDWTGSVCYVVSVLTSLKVFHVWLLWLCLQSVNWGTVNGPTEVTVSTMLMMS